MSRKSFYDLSKRHRRTILNDIIQNANEEDERLIAVQAGEQMNEARALDDIHQIQENDQCDDLADPNENDEECVVDISSSIDDEEQLSESDTDDEGPESGGDSDIDNEEVDNEEHDDFEREEEINEGFNSPLYTGAPLTVLQSMMLTLSVVLSHSLSQACLADILALLNFHCINNRLYRNSLYKFKKFFTLIGNNAANFTKHFYCSICLMGLNSQEDDCNSCRGIKKRKVEHFITFSIIDQLRELYKRRGFYENLQHRFRRQNDAENVLQDLYDGNLYKQFLEGFLNNPWNISFTWYTDGVPVFKSAKISVWPIYLSINELPFRERTRRHNLLLAGLWYGQKKPDANNFFHQLRPQFETLEIGENFILPGERNIRVKGVLLFGTCDLPAKSQFLNLTQFNGEFGCPSCLNPGETVQLPSGGTTHAYRYTDDYTMRTSAQTNLDALTALEQNKAVTGVKGISSLSKLMPDFITGTAIDRMHCIDGGVVKKMLTLWFDAAHKKAPFSMVDMIKVINQRLVAIKPPKFVHRMPRTIEELCHWKASECKMWFFYYSIPVLSDIMRHDYFEHYLLLVTGVALLNTDNISYAMIDNAANLLNKFVRQFETMYGVRYCSINIHLVQHLPECVRNLGPLWAYSCYPYEDLNGQFLNAIHGTRHIGSQIANFHSQQLKMQRHLERLPPGLIRDFCINHRRGVKICEQISDSNYSVGTYKFLLESTSPMKHAIRCLIPIGNIKVYLRLLKDDKLYISELYTRDLQTVSYCVAYTDNCECKFGAIHCFIKETNCECRTVKCDCASTHYAIIQKFSNRRPFTVHGDHGINFEIPYIFECCRENNYVAVETQYLITVCVAINIEDQTHIYVALPVNGKEWE